MDAEEEGAAADSGDDGADSGPESDEDGDDSDDADPPAEDPPPAPLTPLDSRLAELGWTQTVLGNRTVFSDAGGVPRCSVKKVLSVSVPSVSVYPL